MRRRALSLATAILLPALGFLAGAPPAEAAISNASSNWRGNVFDTRDEAHVSATDFWTSNERSNWVTAAPLTLDITPGGYAYYNGANAPVVNRGNASRTVPMYSTISSHLIHGDVGEDQSPAVQAVCPDAAERQAPILPDGGQWFCAVSGVVYFDEPVLGIIATQDGLTSTDSIVREPASIAFTDHNGSARGLEVLEDGWSPRNIGERVEVYGNRVEFTLSLANQLDQIRVITASTDRDPIVGCQDRTINEGSPAPTLTGALRDPDENDFVFVTSFDPGGYGTFVRTNDERWEWTPYAANADDGPTDSRHVRIDVRDRDGDTRFAECDYTVLNVAPDILGVPAQVIDEGQTATQTFSFTDPGADTWTATVQWSDQASPTPVTVVGKTLTISRFFPDDNPTGTPQDTYTALIRVQDDDGGWDTYTHTVVVRNVRPDLVAADAIVIDEGDSIAHTFDFTDPGTDVWTADLSWSDQGGSTAVPVVGKSVSIGRTFPDDDPTGTPQDDYVATVTVRDDDTGVDQQTLLVTVRNVAPVIVPVDDRVIDEGQSVTQTFTFADPGADEWTADVIWDDESVATPVVVDQGTKSFTITRAFPDDDPTATPQDVYVATVTVRDDDTGEHSQTLRVTVNDVAPVIEQIADERIDEGQAIGHTVRFTDVGLLDTHTGTVDYGDGTVEPLVIDPVTREAAIAHTYVDDDPTGTPVDTYTVTVTVTDDDTLTGSMSFVVTVDDVAPVVAPIDGDEIDEGQGITRTVSFSDVGLLDTHEVVVDYGDGTVETLTVDPVSRTAELTHVFVDDDPTATPVDTYTVTVTVTDDDTLAGSTTFDVIVHDVAPDVEITSPYSGALYPVGSTVPVTAPFTDPGLADTFVCDWEWDDLLTPGLETFAGTFDGSTGAGNCDAAHTFNEAGVYSVRVTVTDDDTLSDSADILIVIYDPSAGFVTGGGQIDSPAGAYVADPSLTGQATFGFNAKYKKGATVPQGSTEFQFRAGGMNFHSSDLQWLVVTGNKTKAQFKGFGTINGSGDYGFLLTAYDLGNGQGVDQLRMKIWDRSTGDLVYDNSLGSSDDVDAANPTTIARGQIQIH